MKYSDLIDNIEQLHHSWHVAANRAVNVSLTLRNWCIGLHIVEYELNGADRADYGSGLLKNLEQALKPSGIKGMTVRAFRDYRRLYTTYPHIRGLLTPDFYSS